MKKFEEISPSEDPYEGHIKSHIETNFNQLSNLIGAIVEHRFCDRRRWVWWLVG